MVKNNKYLGQANKLREQDFERLGKVGDLDQSLLDEWDFWRVVKINPDFLIHENKLSFPDLQKLNAVLDMSDDYNNAIEEYYKQKVKEK